jgi:amino-acid N-acetyltransferase
LPKPESASATPIEHYSIRPASQDDLEGVMGLLRPYVEQRKLLRRTKAETAALLGTGFVALVGTEIVGFSSVEIYSRKLAEIQCLAVKEGHQGHGLGSELVRSCVELARQRGVMEVMAISASEKFLQNLGFDYSLPDQKRALFYQLRTREDLFKEREGIDE